MPIFDQASHFIINQPTFVETTNIVNSGETELRELYKHVACGASYDSKDQYDKPKCHHDTRKQLLSDVHEWVKVLEKETGIMFLHGPAGSGKSCIARSVCERAAKEGLLGASFFFWRNSSSRNNESRLITTLAYQLAEGNTAIRQQILSEIANNPRIVDMPLEVQFRKLILEPCTMVPTERLRVRVIVIDGLDECMGEETQIGILQMLARAVRYEGFPIGFFVTSRPELHLQEALDSKEVIFASTVVSLHRLPGVSRDIRTVLESGFARVLNTARFKRMFKTVSRPWPTAESIDKLVLNSSGQFIYAETVLKYVSDPDNNPVSQLQKMLHIQETDSASTEFPLTNLDRLYYQIMPSGVRDPKLTTKVLSYVITIQNLDRRHIITRRELKFSPVITRSVLHNQNKLLLVVEQLLGLPDGMAYNALNQLHSLIALKVGSECTWRHLELDFYHKSFQDFLTTKERSTTFFVKLDQAHFEIAQSCLKFMEHQKYETIAQHVAWIYSCFQWYVHGMFGHKKVDYWNFDTALQRSFFQSVYNLNIHNLKLAQQTLGLSSTLNINEEASSMRNHGLLSLGERIHLVNDVRRTFASKGDKSELNRFNKSYAYPLWIKFLQSYNDDAQIKQLLLAHHFVRLPPVNIFLSESEELGLLKRLGLISSMSEQISVLLRYIDLKKRVNKFMDKCELKEFLETAAYSGTFHCAPEDFSNVYTCILSTGIWRSHIREFCTLWGYYAKIAATGPLLACLESEALEFYDNLELGRRLDRYIERRLFVCLCENLKGPTEEAVNAWKRTFQKARCSFPEKFYELS